jgi:SnoaL-like domain
MPSMTTLRSFVARVEQGAHAEAIEEFYAENASMQENQAAPRVGRDNLVRHEKGVLRRASAVRSQCVHPILVDADHVVIRWVFEFDWLDGTRTRMEELAYQQWSGDRIVTEQFFYDPAQLAPVRAT